MAGALVAGALGCSYSGSRAVRAAEEPGRTRGRELGWEKWGNEIEVAGRGKPRFRTEQLNGYGLRDFRRSPN